MLKILLVSIFLFQLNSANEKNREAPLVTSTESGKLHLDIDHGTKGDVSAECDKTPDVTVTDASPDRPKTKTVYHNCELTYEIN